MSGSPLARGRRRMGLVLFVALALAVGWLLSPGIPVLSAPRASAEAKAVGKDLFEREWSPHDPLAGGDGLGPVFNARSCVSCHFQGGVGGGGSNHRNVLVYEVHPTSRNPEVKSGLVHAYAVNVSYAETPDLVRQQFPVIPGGKRVFSGCSVRVASFDPVRLERINTTALFGAGWIDRLSSKSITHNRARRTLANITKDFDPGTETVPAGRPRILPGGRVGKFGWKGQFATLEQFVAAACANEIGLGNPLMPEAKPMADPDHEPSAPDLDRKQFASLVAFVDTLPRPMEIAPADPERREQAARGKELFGAIGCAQCHVPDIGGVRGVYSDFLLYRMKDPLNQGYGFEVTAAVPRPERGHPEPDEWRTPPLWGVADSAPYFHDGRSGTLEAAIQRHRGDAATVGRTYERLSHRDRQAIVAFLKTLRAPPDAEPVDPSVFEERFAAR